MPPSDDDEHAIAGSALRARIKAHGAELSALQDSAGRDYLWPATPPWPRHAPNLFPIVGRLRNDTLRHDGVSYPMTQHGFARDHRFAWVERTPISCVLSLSDDAETRTRYPFAFRFDIAYEIAAATLTVTFTVTNTGAESLPASMGAHPAFRWPLVEGVAKEAHTLTFDAIEAPMIRGVVGGLLTAADRPSPLNGRVLPLTPSLFARDALILDNPASRSVRFGAPGTPTLTVSWDGFPQLGVWSRADADFLCIEPWHGMASPEDFDGPFIEKPWLMHIPPGESVSARYSVAVTP
jgi:galactose mutarotase-like enzyme